MEIVTTVTLEFVVPLATKLAWALLLWFSVLRYMDGRKQEI